MPRKKKSFGTQVYQLKIVLQDAPVPIWRRLEVKADMSLDILHEVFQILMGWEDRHLHAFKIGKAEYHRIMPDPLDRGPNELDETKYAISDLVKRAGSGFLYRYDFGDCWEHLVALESTRVVPVQEDGLEFFARCLDGRRACPPEDVGGVAGYERFLEVIEDELHPEHRDLVQWIGCRFEADTFDIRTTNQRLWDLNLAIND
jgi:hypothetical protein